PGDKTAKPAARAPPATCKVKLVDKVSQLCRAELVREPSQLRRIVVAVGGGDSVWKRQRAAPASGITRERCRRTSLTDLDQPVRIIVGVIHGGLSRHRHRTRPVCIVEASENRPR